MVNENNQRPELWPHNNSALKQQQEITIDFHTPDFGHTRGECFED